MLQIQGLLSNLDFMKSLAMLPRLRAPSRHGSFIDGKSRHDGLERTSQGQECDHPNYGFGRILFAVKERSLRGAEGLLTGAATIALAQAIMDTNVALVLQTS